MEQNPLDKIAFNEMEKLEEIILSIFRSNEGTSSKVNSDLETDFPKTIPNNNNNNEVKKVRVFQTVKIKKKSAKPEKKLILSKNILKNYKPNYMNNSENKIFTPQINQELIDQINFNNYIANCTNLNQYQQFNPAIHFLNPINPLMTSGFTQFPMNFPIEHNNHGEMLLLNEFVNMVTTKNAHENNNIGSNNPNNNILNGFPQNYNFNKLYSGQNNMPTNVPNLFPFPTNPIFPYMPDNNIMVNLMKFFNQDNVGVNNLTLQTNNVLNNLNDYLIQNTFKTTNKSQGGSSNNSNKSNKGIIENNGDNNSKLVEENDKETINDNSESHQ